MQLLQERNLLVTFVILKRTPNGYRTTELEDLVYIVCIWFCFRVSGEKILRLFKRKMDRVWNCQTISDLGSIEAFLELWTSFFNFFSCCFHVLNSRPLGCFTGRCYLWQLNYPGRLMSFVPTTTSEPFRANSLRSHRAGTKKIIFYGTMSHPCTANLFLTELTNQTKKNESSQRTNLFKDYIIFL